MSRAFYNMDDAPRDRNILVKTATLGYVGFGHPDAFVGAYAITGYAWVECWWKDGKLVEWRGNKRTTATSTILPVCWAELPEE